MCLTGKKAVDIEQGTGFKIFSVCRINGEIALCDYNNRTEKVPYKFDDDGWVRYDATFNNLSSYVEGFCIYKYEFSDVESPSELEIQNILLPVEFKKAIFEGYSVWEAYIVKEFRPIGWDINKWGENKIGDPETYYDFYS